MRESAIRCPWDGEPTVAWHLIACPPYCPRRWHLHVAASCDHIYSVDMDGQMYTPMTGAPPSAGGGTVKVRETTIGEFEREWTLASYELFGRYRAAVFTREEGGYGIRVLTGSRWSANGSRSESYDYFDLAPDGLVLASPRGQAKRYNNRVRVTDIAEAAERYAQDAEARP